MNKLLLVARKEIVRRFTDPAALVLSIAVPIALAALLGLAFGDLVLGRGLPDVTVTVGIVNQDRGGAMGNLGEALVQTLRPDADTADVGSDSPFGLFSVREYDDVRRARRLVESEELVAALLVPPAFSQEAWAGGGTIHLYINGRSDIRGAAFKIVVETLAHTLSTRRITVQTAIEGLVQRPHTRVQLMSGALNDAIRDLQQEAGTLSANPIDLVRPVEPIAVPPVRLVRYLATSIAVLFTGFTGLIGSASLLQERAQGTWQRMLITPTRSLTLVVGKLLGTYVNGVIQLATLVGAIAAVEWVLGGGGGADAGVSLLGLLLLILSTVAASTGLGLVVAGLATTHAQAANYGRALLLLLGLLGGVFFPTTLFPLLFRGLSRVTFHYWAIDGYLRLARGGGMVDILPHLLALTAMGVVFVALGHGLLRRRLRIG